MRVLVTGGAGFIGARLSRHLVSRGHAVRVLDNLSPQIHGPDALTRPGPLQQLRAEVELVVGSVTDPEVWRQAIAGQDAVVHLAAETGTGQSMYESDRYVQVNVSGTALMLDALGTLRNSVSKVVVSSSRAVIGEGAYRDGAGRIVFPPSRRDRDLSQGRFGLYCETTGEELESVPTDESAPFQPTSVYGITKQAQEQLVTTGCAALGRAFVALRYQNVYGPGQSLSNPYTGLLSIFSTRLLSGRGIEVFEDGEESRDFVFIDDVVAATTAALERDAANNHVIGIGSGTRTSVLQAARGLAAALGCEPELRISGRYRLGDIRHNCADLSRARQALGYVPTVTFEEGLRRFVAWVREQGPGSDGYERSLEELGARGMLRGARAHHE
ncbi:NAD-dependent epimerase/dehydratase family protein [Pseudogemmatithrix spongiicola]|uniref:NAD-dependent epimerase/dehydratase family protein n=1 Tax=Pseudogemmatithrix spongiicola TaxID=3062599 RepID=A0AA49Q778_9BACT|nr:NAD-dependent epimerase/dehydratase family protein [Gemmatimonadaceae bacterium 'strain 138']WKW15433.1 NAD-dependent epimerase/dehydratase family protein [Gemmatimonadaceae bacterium 'strain 318']